MNKKHFFSIFLISLFIFFSCNLQNKQLQESSLDDESTAVKICLNFDGSRQVMPASYVASEYKLKGTYNSKETVWTYNSLSKLQSATLYLNYGDWSFTLEAYSNNILIASDTITKTITDSTNILSFEFKVSELNYSEGFGNISVSVSFPTNKKVSSVVAALYTTENLSTPISNTTTTYTTFSTNATGNYIVSYSKDNYSSGSYYLVFKFYQSGVEDSIGMWRDLICVANGCLSSAESSITEFNELYSINYHLNGISFKAAYVAPATFNKSQSITLPTSENMDETNLSFTGWYETSDFSGDVITGWVYDSKTTDVNLYARNTASVSFNMNNYGNQITSQTVVYGEKASEPVKPESDTMFFKGWFTDSELTQKYSFNTVITSNKTVYAKWVDLETYWSWSYPTSAPTLTWEGKGTQDEPYIIMNSQELADLAYMVNNYSTYSGIYFILGSDIELNYGKTVTGIDDTLNNWVPIGNVTHNFAGTVNGNGKKIKGLYVNNDSLDYVGLFGIGNAPNNLTIDSGYISANASYTGSIIGYSKSEIRNCVNKASLINSKGNLGGIAGLGITFKNCENYGSLIGQNVGGITEYGITLDSCINNGEITANGSICGGIVGNISKDAVIKNCSNLANLTSQGNYLGGIVCFFDEQLSAGYHVELKNSTKISILNSKNSGKLFGTHTIYIGGIIAFIGSQMTLYDAKNSMYNMTSCDISIKECDSDGDIEATNGSYLGGICGYISLRGHITNNNIITNCTYSGTIRNTSLEKYYSGGICGYYQGGTSPSLETINILNCYAKGLLEDNSSNRNTLGGIIGISHSGNIINCFSNIVISTSDTTEVGGIVGKISGTSSITNCFYVTNNGANFACPPGDANFKTSVGAVTSSSGAVFSTDNTILLYTGTLCEVLNAYRTENNLTTSYKEWIVGEDGWPTFAE